MKEEEGKERKENRYHNTRHPHTPQPHNKHHILLVHSSNVLHGPRPRLETAPHGRERRQIARIPQDVFDVNEAGLVHDAESGVARLAEEGAPDLFFLAFCFFFFSCRGPGQEMPLLAGVVELAEVGAVGGVASAALRAGTA